MKISIITATFNSENTIGSCIESVNSQTYHNIEHIVIDGASNDNTMDILKNTPGRITTVVSEPDQGVYDALNKGIKLAKGDFIGFLHSDDVLASPKTIENVILYFNSCAAGRKSKPDVVYGDLVFVDKCDVNNIVRYWKSKTFNSNLLKQGWMPAHPTMFMKREAYSKYGLFNINLKCSADYDYILRVFNDQSLEKCYIPLTITRMRMGGISTGGIKNLINKSKEDYWVLKKNKMAYPLWTLFLKVFSKFPQLIFKKECV